MPIVSEEHKNQRKKEILDSALACFASKGYNVATMSDIVKQSGLSKGAIYNYFKSKEEIYIELMKLEANQVQQFFSKELTRFPTAIEKLAFLFDYYLDIEADPKGLAPSLVQFEFQLSSSRREDLMKIIEEIRYNSKTKIISDILIEGQTSGEFKHEINIGIYSELFWSFIDGATTQKLLFPDYPYHELLKSQKRTFLDKVIN